MLNQNKLTLLEIGLVLSKPMLNNKLRQDCQEIKLRTHRKFECIINNLLYKHKVCKPSQNEKYNLMD